MGEPQSFPLDLLLWLPSQGWNWGPSVHLALNSFIALGWWFCNYLFILFLYTILWILGNIDTYLIYCRPLNQCSHCGLFECEARMFAQCSSRPGLTPAAPEGGNCHRTETTWPKLFQPKQLLFREGLSSEDVWEVKTTSWLRGLMNSCYWWLRMT